MAAAPARLYPAVQGRGRPCARDKADGGSNSILPALAFSLDMFQNTHSQYGVNEVLLASVLGALVFSLFAAQPLTIIGVTGTHLWRLSSRLVRLG